MVDGRTFSPADSDTKNAKGITHRHTVKYASTLMPIRNKDKIWSKCRRPYKGRKEYQRTERVHGKSEMNLLLRMDNTLVQSTGRPYNGLPPLTLRENTRKKKTSSLTNNVYQINQIIQLHTLSLAELIESVNSNFISKHGKPLSLPMLLFPIIFSWCCWWDTFKAKDSKAIVFRTYHKREWSLGSSEVCTGMSAGGRSKQDWWRGQLPPSTLGSLQTHRGLPAHLSKTTNIPKSRHMFC